MRRAIRHGYDEPDNQRQRERNRSRNWLEAHVESPSLRYRGNRISDDVCLILVGTGRLKRIWQQLFFMFFFWVFG